MLDLIEKKFKLRKFLDIFTIKINPNIITILALIAAVIAGYLFYEQYVLFAGLFVLLNGFLDILDGQIAKKFGTSKLGDFLDHTFDRLADVAIFSGIALSGIISKELGFITLIFILLVSYLGTQAQAITNKRLYSGILGRADRLVILVIISILYLFYNLSIYYGILLILIFSIITFLQRFFLCYHAIKSS